MTEELYINGKFIQLAGSGGISLTYQVNDIAELSDRQASYSNRFNIPYTNSNEVALNHSHILGSDTMYPYRRLPATYFTNGIPRIQNGVAIIEQSSNGWDITLYSGIFDFFTQLGDRSLKDFDWSEYNHVYNMSSIRTINQNYLKGLSDICWPLINWGAYKANQNVDIKYQQPAISLSVIMDKMFSITTYSKSGQIFNEGIYQDMCLTLSPDEYEVTDEELQARSFYAALSQSVTDAGLPSQGGPAIINLLSYFSVTGSPGYDAPGLIIRDNKPIRVPWPQAYNAPSLSDTRYISNTYTTLDISIKLLFNNLSIQGIEAYRVYKNNVLVRIISFGDGGGPTTNFGFEDTYTIDLKPGDTIKVLLYATNFSINNLGIATNFLKFNAVSTTPYNSTLSYNQLIPDYKLKDILRSVCQQFAIILTPSNTESEIIFTTFPEIKKNISKSEDWTNKIDLTKGYTLNYRIGNYAQKNLMKYAPDEYTQGFGDSYFEIDDNVLPPETTLFELLWPSCLPEINIRTTSKKFIYANNYSQYPEWSKTTAYTSGQIVGYNYVLYVALQNVPIANIPIENSAYWQISIASYIANGSNMGVKIDRYTLIKADQWNFDQEYSIGDEVNYSGKIYVSSDNGNIGNQPPDNPDNWTLRNVQYEQSITSASRMVLVRGISPKINPSPPSDAIYYTDGVSTLISNTVDYPMAYFSDPGEPYNLTMQYIQATFYAEIILMLVRLKVLGCFIDLSDKDIQELDFLTLKYIEFFGNHFYLNKVESGEYGSQCQLIRM